MSGINSGLGLSLKSLSAGVVDISGLHSWVDLGPVQGVSPITGTKIRSHVSRRYVWNVPVFLLIVVLATEASWARIAEIGVMVIFRSMRWLKNPTLIFRKEVITKRGSKLAMGRE